MEELVEKAKNNDKLAFSKLIKSIEKELYLTAKTRLKNEDDMEDAIQETVFKCYKNIKMLRDNSLFKAWAIKILINECNNIYRRKNKNIISYEEKEMENYISADNDDEKMEFELLIQDLSYEEKIILTLYYYSRYTIREISKIAKVNQNTIKGKMARARKKIKRLYENE